jgi:hypothetical protein
LNSPVTLGRESWPCKHSSIAGVTRQQTVYPEVDDECTTWEADPEAGMAPEWWRETPVERWLGRSPPARSDSGLVGTRAPPTNRGRVEMGDLTPQILFQTLRREPDGDEAVRFGGPPARLEGRFTPDGWSLARARQIATRRQLSASRRERAHQHPCQRYSHESGFQELATSPRWLEVPGSRSALSRVGSLTFCRLPTRPRSAFPWTWYGPVPPRTQVTVAPSYPRLSWKGPGRSGHAATKPGHRRRSANPRSGRASP